MKICSMVLKLFHAYRWVGKIQRAVNVPKKGGGIDNKDSVIIF
jgi:hypothetical protein